MSTREWPASLPYQREASGSESRPSRAQPETEMEGGNVRLRRRPGDRLRTEPWSRRLAPEAYGVWSVFLAETIAQGTRRFLMPVWAGSSAGDGYELRLVQISGGAGGVSEAPTGRGLYMHVSFSLLVFPAEMVAPPVITSFGYLILGTGFAGWTVDVEIDGIVRSAAVAADGSFEIEAPDLSPGPHIVRVRHGHGLWSEAQHYTIAGAPLDGFAGSLYGLFGLRRLVSTYAGAVVRVRRSSDGAEADIGVTLPGALDIAALLAFAGSASAFVVTWYDQSGNGRQATQSVTASQPRLVNAGAVDIGPNGLPILVFSGAQSLGIAGAAGFARNASNLTVAAVGMSSAPSGTSGFFTTSRGANLSWYRVGLLHTPTLTAVRLAASANDADNPPLASRAYTTGAWARLIGRARFLDGTLDMGINGGTTSAALGTAVASVDSDGVTRIGIAPNGGVPLTGQMSALVLSRSALDIAALDTALQGIMP